MKNVGFTRLLFVVPAVLVLLDPFLGIGAEPQTLSYPERYIGFKNNGSGVFPETKPPLEWNEGVGKNILWKAPLPAWSAGSPIVLSNKIILMAEPNLVLCFAADTGRELWRTALDPSEGRPVAEAIKARALRDRWNAELAKLLDLYFEIQQLESWMALLEGKKDKAFRENFACKLHPELLDQCLEQLQKKPADEVAQLRTRLAEIIASQPKWGRMPIRLGDLCQNESAGWKSAASELASLGYPFETWLGYIGNTFATPVSDGQWVYVSTAQGVVACLDLNGKMRWRKWKAPDANPRLLYTNSPLLCGDKLLLIAGGEVCALNKNTGEEIWTKKYGTQAENHAGSPVLLRLNGVDLLVTSHGRIYRIADGAVMAENLPAMVATPALEGDRALFNVGSVHGTENKLKAFGYRFLLENDKVRAERLWETPLPGRAGIWVGPTLLDGLGYYSYPQNVTVLNLATGAQEIRHIPNQFQFGGSHAPNTVIAGGHVFAGNCYGQTFVFGLGKKGKVVACNQLESELFADHVLMPAAELRKKYWSQGFYPWPYGFTAATPFFSDSRAYLRSHTTLYCVGMPQVVK